MALRAIVAGVEAAGVSRERFLRDAALDADRLRDGLARISVTEYRHAVHAALVSSRDPALGLHMGEVANITWYDVLGHLALHSANLREALQMCGRYARIATDSAHLELHEHGDTATIKLAHHIGDATTVRFAAEFSTSALLLSLIRPFIGEGVQPRVVSFEYDMPAHHAEYTRIFAGRARFARELTGLEIERRWLDQSQLHHSVELSTLLQSRAELLMTRLEGGAPATERVRHWLASHSLKNKPIMDAVARDLGMSGRSLRRRLFAEGSEYYTLVEEARADCAKRMLVDPQRSVQEAAYELGFATPAAFTRAFKRWTGLSPSAFRSAR
ncbi:MAG: AraC family transcriptional regulator [Polyangiales bacterium]